MTYTTLKSGSRGEAVRKLQTALTEEGYTLGKIDGIYGVKTVAAVKAFQSDNGLTVDGIAGNTTQTKLYYMTPEEKETALVTAFRSIVKDIETHPDFDKVVNLLNE